MGRPSSASVPSRAAGGGARSRPARAAAATALASLLGVAARADEPLSREAPLMVRDTNAALFAREAAKEAIAADDVPRAIREIASLLGPLRHDLVLVDRADEQTRWISAPEAAARLLAEMPRPVLRAWQEAAEAAARPALEAAADRRDEEGLREVLSRHPGSPSASAAARLLAEAAFESGRFPDAAAAAAEGLRFAPDDAGLWIRRIDALGAAGDVRALDAIASRPELAGTATAGGRTVSLRARLEEARRSARPRSTEGWPVWGGEAAHDRVFPAAPSIRPLRWSVGEPLRHRGNDDGRNFFRGGSFMPDRSDQRFDGLWPAYAPLFPALADRVLYVGDGRTVSAYDLYSGRARWAFPGPSGAPGIAVPDTQRGRTNLASAYAPCVEGGRVFGTVEVESDYRPRYLQDIEYTTYIPRRVLVALDAASGRPLWRMGERPEDAELLGEASVAGPAVAAQGLVFVPVVRYGGGSRVWVVAFEAATGRVAWDRYLVNASQELNLFGEPVKELFAGAVAVEGGVVYAGTGLGVLAALDARTGGVRWMSTYERVPIHHAPQWYTTPLRFPLWGPAPPQVHGDALVVAPPDSPSLHVFDRDTGALRWRERAQSNETFATAFDHVLGVATVEGASGRTKGVVTTGSALHVYDLATGNLVVQAPIGAKVLGRGALTADGAYVPTSAGLARYTLGPGALRAGLDAWPPGAGPGNVLAFPGVLVVASRGRIEGEEPDGSPSRRPVQGFFAWEEIERELSRRRGAAPGDPAVILELADVMRVSGQWTRARSTYEEAAKVAVAADDAALAERAREGLHRTQLDRGDVEAAEERFDSARDAYQASLAHASRADQRVAARLRLERALLALDDDDGRLENLAALAREDGGLGAPPDLRDLVDADVAVRPWARIEAARIHERAGRGEAAVDLLQAVLREDGKSLLPEGTAREVARQAIDRIVRASPEAYRRHEEAALALLARARTEKDERPIERLLAEYPNASAVADALLDLARARLEEGEAREAVAAIQRLLETHPGHRVEPAALATLARALASTGAVASAHAALRRLERLHGDEELTIDGAATTGARFAAEERARLPSRESGRGLSPLEPPLEEVARVDLEEDGRLRILTVEGLDRALREIPALVSVGHEVVAVDVREGRVRFRVPVGSGAYAAVVEDVLVLGAGDALVGVDPSTGAELWRQTMEGIVRDLEPVEGRIAVLTTARDPERPRSHVALLDALDGGREAWSRDLGSGAHLAVWASDDHLLVRRLGARDLAGSTESVLLLSLADGSQAGEIPMPSRGSYVMPRLVDRKTLVVAGRDPDGDFVEAWDVPEATRRWRTDLASVERLSSQLLSTPTEVVVTDRNGTVTRLALADGTQTGRITLGEGLGLQGGSAAPILDGPNVIAILQGRAGPVLGAFDFTSGKTAWTVPLSIPPDLPSTQTLERSGDVLVLTLVRFGRRAPPSVEVTLLRASDGTRLQSVAEDAASGGSAGIRVHSGSLLLVSRSSIVVWR